MNRPGPSGPDPENTHHHKSLDLRSYEHFEGHALVTLTGVLSQHEIQPYSCDWSTDRVCPVKCGAS